MNLNISNGKVAVKKQKCYSLELHVPYMALENQGLLFRLLLSQ